MRFYAESETLNDGSARRLAEQFDLYMDHARREDERMLARLNTLLSSQSFLAIAYATSMGSANGRWREPFALLIPPVLALLGLVLAFAGHLDIAAAKREASRWRSEATSLMRDHSEVREGMDDSVADTPSRSSGKLFASRAPVAFILAWSWFLIVPIYLWVGL